MRLDPRLVSVILALKHWARAVGVLKKQPGSWDPDSCVPFVVLHINYRLVAILLGSAQGFLPSYSLSLMVWPSVSYPNPLLLEAIYYVAQRHLSKSRFKD